MNQRLADKTMGAVDVFIPCYNYGRFLRGAVASVLQQDGPPTRVLIIDDASTDETPLVATALAAEHSNVSYLRHAMNIGHISTYNEGIAWAENPYLVLLSADDMLAPGALRRAASFLDAHPGVGLVYGRTRIFRDDQSPVPQADVPQGSRVIEGHDFVRSSFTSSQQPIASSSSLVVRTDLQQSIGGYLHDLPHAGDMEMYLRFGVHAQIGCLDADQGFYRLHSSQMSRGYRELRDYHQRLLVFETLCRNYPEQLPDHVELLRRAKQAMAEDLFWTASGAFDRGDAFPFDSFLELASTLDPSIRRHRSWRRFQVKRMLGRQITRCASSLVSLVQGRPDAAPRSTAGS